MPLLIPDVLLAQLVWGPRSSGTPWPRRWRQKLRGCTFLRGAWKAGPCSDGCPIHGCEIPHGHFRFNLGEQSLGRVAALAAAASTGETGRTFDFTNPEGVEGLRACYLPSLLFAASPKSRITPRQGLVLSQLAGQVTRTRARVLRTRADKAQVFGSQGGCGVEADDYREHKIADCPFLTGGEPYVAFNGNKTNRMRHKPHGYGLRVATRAKAAGCERVSAYLRDLGVLSAEFGLVVGGYEPKARRWYSLEQMTELGEAAGELLLRVYTTPDYRDRWRALFFGWLGFDPARGTDAVAGDADVERLRAARRRKTAGPAAQVAATETATTPPPDSVQLESEFMGLLTALHRATSNATESDKSGITARVVRGSTMHVVMKYYAALRLRLGDVEAELRDAARVEYRAHASAWQSCFSRMPGWNGADGPGKQVVARLEAPTAPPPVRPDENVGKAGDG